MRVHEPLLMIDLLDVETRGHSWPLHAALARLQGAGRGVALLLNCGEDAATLASRLSSAAPGATLERGPMVLRLHGIGAQILRDLGIVRMALLASPRRLLDMAGFGLEVTSFIEAQGQRACVPAQATRPESGRGLSRLGLPDQAWIWSPADESMPALPVIHEVTSKGVLGFRAPAARAT